MHISVLAQEVLAALQPGPTSIFIDGTVGAGGHSAELLTASAPNGRVLGLDQDPNALAIAREHLARFGPRTTLMRANFRDLAAVARVVGFDNVDGILLDLGFSSLQMDDPMRGLSFSAEAPLDMRLDPDGPTTAADLVNTLSEQDLANLIYQYGEERHSRKIARALVARRPFESAKALGDTIAQVIPRRRGDPLHPATRTFQALRIATNDELGVLEAVLPQAVSLLKPGGRLAVISFHSLEDRIVKNYFRQEATDCICPPEVLICQCGHKAILRPVEAGEIVPADRPIRRRDKLVTPSQEEIAANPRARSAKLRVAERLPTEAKH